ncbi:Glycosyltransferase involved in cell wall bisynthesis [Sphingobium faniae]|nr:Glycosyltransferase involved in cell wall bisynthesis [Sphingobium faniae]
MKILHVITALNVGGAETMLARLLEHERMQGGPCEASVLSLMPPGVAGARVRESGIALHDCGLVGVGSLLPGLVRLRAAVRRESPDLIMAWMYHAHLAARLGTWLRRGRIPVVWNVRHSIDDLGQEKPALRTIIRLAALFSRWPQAIVYNSHAAARQHERLGFSPDRAMVIPNGFDCDLFQPRADGRDRLVASLGIDPRALIVGMAARNHPMKDAANLVDAVGRARKAGADVHLLLMGQDMDRPAGRFAQLTGELPADRLTLRGHVPSLADVLPGLDLLVLPSAWGEGFPNILGEAMACGVPCIATDVGDSRWIVGDAGITVPPRDPDRLAQAMVTMWRLGADGRKRLGAAARERVKADFSIGRIAASYGQLYQTIGGHTEPSRDSSRSDIRQAQVM